MTPGEALQILHSCAPYSSGRCCDACAGCKDAARTVSGQVHPSSARDALADLGRTLTLVSQGLRGVAAVLAEIIEASS